MRPVIGILDVQFVLKFQIFSSIRVGVLRFYVIFTPSEIQKFRNNLERC